MPHIRGPCFPVFYLIAAAMSAHASRFRSALRIRPGVPTASAADCKSRPLWGRGTAEGGGRGPLSVRENSFFHENDSADGKRRKEGTGERGNDDSSVAGWLSGPYPRHIPIPAFGGTSPKGGSFLLSAAAGFAAPPAAILPPSGESFQLSVAAYPRPMLRGFT